MSPRVAATLVSLVLLGAGCSDVPSVRPAADASATPPLTSVPVSPGLSPTKSAQPPRRLTLLPPACRDSQLRLRPWSGEGAGGWLTAYTRVALASGNRCTMRGFPRVRLIDTESRLLPLRYRRSEEPAHPIVVSRTHPGLLMIAKYRCDIAASPRRTGRALILLPGLTATRTVPFLDRIPLCAPRDPSHAVAVWPLNSNGPRLHPPYAVTAGSPILRHPAAAWGRADLDGDGRQETVVVRRTGEVTVRNSGERLTLRVHPGGPAFLQGLSDLDADGRAEILLATTASGCCGARPSHGTTYLYRLTAQGLVRLGSFNFSSGAGDSFTALRCGDGTFVHVSAYDPRGRRPLAGSRGDDAHRGRTTGGQVGGEPLAARGPRGGPRHDPHQLPRPHLRRLGDPLTAPHRRPRGCCHIHGVTTRWRSPYPRGSWRTATRRRPQPRQPVTRRLPR